MLHRTIQWLAVALVAVLAVADAARGDEFVDRANAAFARVPADLHAHAILFPALAGMADPPGDLGELEDGRPIRAMLLGPGMADWNTAIAWATSAEQQAVIAAMDEITRVPDATGSMLIAQPYGIGGVPATLVRADLYTELGDPPTMAAAEHRYLPAMSTMVVLAHVEATRRLDEGRGADALDVLVDLMHVGRMMADRQFHAEVAWGYRTMIDAAIRLRDIAFVDYNASSPTLSDDDIQVAINRLTPGRRGFLLFDRLRFPAGNYEGGLQILGRIFEPRGQASDRFAAVMSALTSTDTPLRRFGDAGRWERVSFAHADGLDTRQKLADVHNDWRNLWPQDDFAPGHQLVREYDRLDPVRHAVVQSVLPDMTGLFNERRILQVEVLGTRQALGVVAYADRIGTLPNDLNALRPAIIDERELDPFAPREDARGRSLANEFKYLRPRIDLPVDPRLGPQPLPVDVVMLNQRNFGIDVGITDDEFVLWSVGPDTDDDTARRVRENTRALYDGDYLIWPPVLSVYREFLAAQNELN
ncbi:MAG: hypothetical protein AAFX79_04795 [Planctomycetota bacterium]